MVTIHRKPAATLVQVSWCSLGACHTSPSFLRSILNLSPACFLLFCLNCLSVVCLSVSACLPACLPACLAICLSFVYRGKIVSMSNLAFCVGGNNSSCSNASTVASAGSSVSDELGTSGPWQSFLKYGGMLFLALIGTCAVW